MRHIDAELAADAGFRSRVNALLNEMRGEQELAARRKRYLDLSARTARELDAKGITEKKLQADFEKFNFDCEKDGVFVAECPAVPGCISQGATEKEALKNVEEAIRECLEVRAEKGMPLPVTVHQVEIPI